MGPLRGCHNGGVREREPGLVRFRRYTWWSVPGTAVTCLVVFVGEWIADPDVPVPARAASAAALLATAVASGVLLSRRLAPARSGEPPGRPPLGWLAAGGAGAAVLGAVPLALGNYGLWAVAPAIMVAIAAAVLPPARRRVLLGCAAALAPVPGGAASLAADDGQVLYASLFPLGLLVFSCWVTLGPLWAWDVAARLDEARRMSAELAVKDERLRFAADLHDIQGHHLQVIALKSELAARLAAADPARAAAEMEEVRRLAADALHDTRAVVQGYRRTTLDEEIANATRVLAAADIDARTHLDPSGPGRLAESSRHLLGLVVREGTTNVLRHSRARHAEVDYRVTGGTARLRMSNDGAAGRSAGPPGSGLRTLAERLHAAGGELTWEHDGDRFTVAATLRADPNGGPE